MQSDAVNPEENIPLNKQQEALLLKLYQHKDDVVRYALKLTNYDKLKAEDIVSDAILKLSKRILRNKVKDDNLKGLFFTTAYTLFIDTTRKQKRMPQQPLQETFFDKTHADDSRSSPDAFEFPKPGIKSFWAKIEKILPKDQYEVLRLRYKEELSFREIAKQTNVSINTALGRMRYALTNLRKNEVPDTLKRYDLKNTDGEGVTTTHTPFP